MAGSCRGNGLKAKLGILWVLYLGVSKTRQVLIVLLLPSTFLVAGLAVAVLGQRVGVGSIIS